MTTQRVVFVAGARPNFMKMAPRLRVEHLTAQARAHDGLPGT